MSCLRKQASKNMGLCSIAWVPAFTAVSQHVIPAKLRERSASRDPEDIDYFFVVWIPDLVHLFLR
jgi:hypothetical protein